MENELCCWGCGNIAVLPKTKAGKGPRCTERHYDCPGFKSLASDKNPLKGTNKKPDGLNFSWANKTLSESHKTAISRGMMGNRNANHRGDRQSYFNGIRFDSRWEVWTAEWLTVNLIEWSYGEHGYRLSDGRYYYPDFFIYERGVLIKLIEVKGYFREANKVKFELFKQDYPETIIELWNKSELYKRHIIDASGKRGSFFKEQ